MLVLIPAYEPDLRLVALVRRLRAAAPDASLLVVDDGSGPAYASVFDVARDAGAHLVTWEHNRGKGAALKAGFAWALEHAPGDPVVCADSDGQHAVADILAVADAVEPGAMTLGVRAFTGRVPLRSRVGNTVSRWAFRAVTGTPVTDTQTGLRGYPASLLGWLASIEGDRFEYEANLLFEARAAGVAVRQVPIETIYLDENASSHFRPVRDSLRIYARLLGFAASSLIGAAIDWAGVLLLSALTGDLLVAVVGARLASAAVNFRVNRDLVFAHAGTPWVRYALLAAGLLTANYTLLALLTGVGVELVAAKLLVEAVLFAASYVVQRRFVFAAPTGSLGAPQTVLASQEPHNDPTTTPHARAAR